MDTLQISVQLDVFEKLQKLAVPLVDDVNTVIVRLIKHWESSPPKATSTTAGSSAPPPQVWRSARGERFPVGLELRCSYLGNTYTAKVTADGIEFDGKLYDNPSSAGIAVKHAAGTLGRAASTNGWDFWEMLDPQTKRWVSIDALRSGSEA